MSDLTKRLRSAQPATTLSDMRELYLESAAYIANLEQTVADRDRYIVSLDKLLVERANVMMAQEVEIGRLRARVEELKEALAGVVAYQKWADTEGGVVPDHLRNAWKRATAALSEPPTGERTNAAD